MDDYLNSDDFLADFLSGKEKAFTPLFHAYWEQLYVFAFKLIGDDAESEDLVSRAFRILFERHAMFITMPNIRAFLYVTVRNSCFSYLRQIQRLSNNKKQLSTFITQHQSMVRADHELERSQIEGEMMKQIHEAVGNLREEFREVLELLYVKNLKYREVAELLNIPIDTVKSRRKYALDKLRKSLSEKNLAMLWTIFLAFSCLNK